MLLASLGVLIAGNVKSYGSIKINDDNFLTIVGSLGSVANSLSRLFWGFMLDNIKFRWLANVNLSL